MDFTDGPMKEGMMLNGRYEVISPLNRGAFGVVVLARDLVHPEPPRHVAVKCLTKMAAPGQTITTAVEANWELLCHERLEGHPGLVSLLDHFETDTHLGLVLEFCPNGDLFEAIRQQRGPVETERVRTLMIQLTDAVEHMHARCRFHCDIKPENIFLSEKGNVKLGDFGLATKENWTFVSGAGTEGYMAPEQYDPGEVGYAPVKVDVWAMGIVLINVVFGRNLFTIPAESDVHFADYLRDPESLYDKYPTMTSDTFEVLRHALAIDPAKRSLAKFREALLRVDAFTTDDAVVDEFCADPWEVVPVGADRRPLPTPSIRTATYARAPMPWTEVPDHVAPVGRETTTAAVPIAGRNGHRIGRPVSITDGAGTLADHDSALGVSLISTEARAASPPSNRPVITLASSTPAPPPPSRPPLLPSLSAIFGRKGTSASKSWFDLCNEDENTRPDEAQSAPTSPSPTEPAPLAATVPTEDGRGGAMASRWSRLTRSNLTRKRSFVASPSSFSSTHDAGGPLAIQAEHRSTTRTGGLLHPIRTPRLSRQAIMDRWAVLGKKRRGLEHASSTSQLLNRGSSGEPKGTGLGLDGAADADDYEWVGGWHGLD
ncbi:MAG: hypothetical protein M1826_005524 [Phylliscum demangeonii]|nr:MAG: hypothetical protein M1826_005524 [Phylliscum demangeonii]